jgi:hypothetical protein
VASFNLLLVDAKAGAWLPSAVLNADKINSLIRRFLKILRTTHFNGRKNSFEV